MHLPLQRQLKRRLPNMYGRHPATAIGRSIIFGKVLGLLLGNHARASTTPLKWPTETVLAVAVGHCNGVIQTSTLKQMHCGKGLRTDGV